MATELGEASKRDSNEARALKEQICFRIDEDVKKLLEKLATKEVRSIGNFVEKLVLQRLHELEYLNEDFKLIKKD